MDAVEHSILGMLDAALSAERVRSHIDLVTARVERQLHDRPGESLAWEPLPLDLFAVPLPASVRSSWVFVLRAGAATGAERHPNSRQRMMSYRAEGDLQTCEVLPAWCSNRLRSDGSEPLERRWISIPENVWHQGVVGAENWAVVSFHTAAVDELIEERPAGVEGGFQRRTYE